MEKNLLKKFVIITFITITTTVMHTISTQLH